MFPSTILHPKCCPRLLQFYQIGEITPNLVTLPVHSSCAVVKSSSYHRNVKIRLFLYIRLKTFALLVVRKLTNFTGKMPSPFTDTLLHSLTRTCSHTSTSSFGSLSLPTALVPLSVFPSLSHTLRLSLTTSLCLTNTLARLPYSVSAFNTQTERWFSKCQHYLTLTPSHTP